MTEVQADAEWVSNDEICFVRQMLVRDDELVSWWEADKLHYSSSSSSSSSNKNERKKYEHDTLWLMQEKDCEVTEITNRNSIRMTENADDVEWVDEWMYSMLNYAEWEVDISAWLTELLDDDRIFRDSMWEILTTDDIFNRQSQLHAMWNQSKVLCDRKVDWLIMSVIKCDCVDDVGSNKQWREAVNSSADWIHRSQPELKSIWMLAEVMIWSANVRQVNEQHDDDDD